MGGLRGITGDYGDYGDYGGITVTVHLILQRARFRSTLRRLESTSLAMSAFVISV